MDETPYQRSRAVKNENQPTGTRWTRNGSPERFLFQNHEISQVKSRGKRLKNAAIAERSAERTFYENSTDQAGKNNRHLV